jgi:hypothetical protein
MIAGGAAWAVLLGGGLAALDAMLLLAFCAESLDWQTALTAHVVIALGAALPSLCGIARGGVNADWKGTIPQFAVWTALLGPFGAVIGLTLFLPEAGAGAMAEPHGTATPGGEGDAAPSRLEMLHNTLLDGRLRLSGGHVVRPMLDIVIEGTMAEKLDALSLIAKRYVPALAPALRRALQDADASVRVLAATVMAQLHNGHTKRIGTLLDAVQAGPTSPAWRTLGAARLEYAASGLLEPDRAGREANDGRACLARAEVLEHAEVPLDGTRMERVTDAALDVVCHDA